LTSDTAPARRHGGAPGHRDLTEFNMLTFTKQDSIVIAVTLAIALGVPLLVPAFYGSTNITVLDRATPPLPNDNFGGDNADSQWRGRVVDCGSSEGLPI